MSIAEKWGTQAVLQGIKNSTQPCRRTDCDKGTLEHFTANKHGNLERSEEPCPECEEGWVAPHWSGAYVQQWVLGSALGAMDECRRLENYDVTWEILDWALAYTARCLVHVAEELKADHGEERGAEILREVMEHHLGGTQIPHPCDHQEPEGALSPEELEELVG